MEFKARYELIGLFSALVILAGFAFVYWLNLDGGFGARKEYRVQFSVPVSGLNVGGGVYFNGIKTGEVTRLELDQSDPKRLTAFISVKDDTPIHTDTIAGIDYQGLTGIASVLLTGGDAATPALTSSNGQPPLLIADPANTRSWSQTAARVLTRFDSMLGRNSGRFDSILAGLEKMTGGGSNKPARTFDLMPVTDMTSVPVPPAGQLVVAEPTIPLALNTDRIQQRNKSGEYKPLAEWRWTDNLPNLLQTRIIQSYENAGYTGLIAKPADVLDPDHRLMIDIRGFYLDPGDQPVAQVELMAKIADRDGKVTTSRLFRTKVPSNRQQTESEINALRTAFQKTTKELIDWSIKALQAG